MRSVAIDFAQHVEHEGTNIKVDSFVVEKQLRQEAQVLTVELKVTRINDTVTII